MAKINTLKPSIQSVRPQLKMLDITPGATPRKRGGAWMAERARWLRANPLCVACKNVGVITAGREVDHIIPLADGGSDDKSNYQTLCIECHKAKTAKENSGRLKAW